MQISATSGTLVTYPFFFLALKYIVFVLWDRLRTAEIVFDIIFLCPIKTLKERTKNEFTF